MKALQNAGEQLPNIADRGGQRQLGPLLFAVMLVPYGQHQQQGLGDTEHDHEQGPG
jgi:hypothetical protein